MSIETIGVPPEEAQFLETRRFQKNEIAGIYRVPPHMIADLERATFSNVEQQSLDFVIHSLTPWLVRIEQAIARDLLLPSERAGIFVEHLVAGLLRGDLASRYASYMTGRQGGWLSANDVRRFENMNPIDGGDEYLVPLNMIPAGDEPDEGRAFVPGGNGGVSLERERTNERYAELLDAIVATRDDEQTADDRRATARSFARVYRDAAQRLANREAADLRRAIDGRLTRDGLADFLAWLDGFYDDLRDVIPPLFEPVMMSLAEQVLDAVDAEIDEEVDRDVDDFVESYLDKYAGAYVTAHHRRLKKIADDEELKGDDELVAAALTAQVDHWQEIEPDRQGRDQPFEAANAVAIAAYAGAGIQFLRWLASGDSCEFCEALSGTVAGIDATFVVKGGTLPGVAGGVMRIGSSKRHGPLHEGCDCIVVPA